jgi:2,3-bisphosphoglycerate-independent phosphoglycerate mutase
VPFAIYGKDITPDRFQAYSERISCESGLVFNQGWDLMNYFINLKRE